MIRLVVVEDETLFRLGLQRLLALDPELVPVGDAADGQQALAVVKELKPDLIIMDVNLPKLSGIAVLQKLREEGDFTPVILISTFDEEDAFLRGMRLGASAYLRKDVPLEELTSAIHAALRGDRVFRPAITEKAVRRLAALKPAFEAAELPDPPTKREIQVLRLMAAGLSNKEIGEALRASEATVKTHVSSVLSKLGVRDRTRAVLKGLELGYI